MARLYVIEAPGKARTIEAILEKVGQPGRVQATKGHLFEMPAKLSDVGIDRSFRDFERKPRDRAVVDRLRAEAMIADEVFIATDADAEGDVIAWDVAELIRDMHPNPQRVRLRGMDQDGVLEALKECRPVDKRDAVAGRTRAIVDRLIGAGFSRNGVAVGRVGTALLGLVAQNDPVVRQLRLSAPAKDGGRPYVAEVDVRAPIDLETAKKLTKLDFPALELARAKPVETRPGNMGDVMVRAGDELDQSPKETAISMQRLYEAGRLSYPRAGARGISPSVAHKVAEVLRKAGYQVTSDNYAKKAEGEVHDAPYPLGAADVSKDPGRLGHDEGVRTLIARDLVKAGQPRTEEYPVVQALWPFLFGKGFSKEVADVVVRLNWRREIGPRYPGQASWPESEIVTRRADTVMLEQAVKAGLGRPSTWANHIEQFMSRELVDEDLNLTAKGRAWIEASPRELLDPRVSIAIEMACEKVRDEMMAHPDREPWEMNAERIVRALPPALQQVVVGLVAHEAPRARIDPVVAYGQAPDVMAQLPQGERSLGYVPESAGG